MIKYKAAELCDKINYHRSTLSYRYEEAEHDQVLTIANAPAVRFSKCAGGSVAGGSAQWVRHKHQKGGIHEPGLIAALLAIADSNPAITTVFDIGALYGYVALIARSIFRHANVHAFEVNPHSFDALRHNIAANAANFGATVFAHHCALSDASAMQQPLRVRGFSVRPDTGEAEPVRGKVVSRIDVWSLDDFCRVRALKPDVIKIDVEGYQAKIVPGAMEVLSRDRPVVLLEFDRRNPANDFGVSNKDVIEPVMRSGYRLIWGRHRDTGSCFEMLDWNDLSDCHEVNSLGILLP